MLQRWLPMSSAFQVRRIYTKQRLLKNTVIGMLKSTDEPMLSQSDTEPELIFHESSDALADRSKPISLVLGFDGAQPRHVEKYVDVYRELRLPCLSYTGTNWHEHAPEPSEGAAFAPLFDEPMYSNRKIFIHCLSMNGFLSLAKLYRWMEHKNISDDRVSAILFDSSPSVPRHEGSAMDVRFAGIWSPPKVMPDGRIPLLLFHHFLENIKLPHHQHYVYSKADKIIDYTHIEEFIAEQVKKGCHVTTKRYIDVQHVRHLTADPTSYKKQVAELIERSTEPIESKL